MPHVCKGLAAIWAYIACALLARGCIYYTHHPSTRWPNIKTTLDQHPLFAGSPIHTPTLYYIYNTCNAMRHAGDVIDLVSSV